MTGWLLATDVISELRKRHCDARVKSWSELHNPSSYFLSSVTLAEIRFGIEQVPEDSAFRGELETWLEAKVRPWFAGRILDIDDEIVLIWRRMVEDGRRQNHTFAHPDLVLAATAALHDLCVVTRNVDDFVKARIRVLNPWTDNHPRLT